MNDASDATGQSAPGASSPRGRVARALAFLAAARARVQGFLVWQVWERMLEIEFVDRSVALAGKAFVSFFPLVIVVAAFMPSGVRTSIFATLTHRLGIEGSALSSAKEAFASADEVRRATGILGLVLTFFFASSFTAAIQRVYLRAWRRAPGRAVSAYGRGMTWLAAVLGYMAILGALRGQLGNGLGIGVFVVAAFAMSSALWWFTAWFLLLGQVRWRVLLPTGIITGVTLSLYALSASIWMPQVVTSNQAQFGFFGVALALTTWFSGAAICILVGACAGPVLAEDTGWIGVLIRGSNPDVLVAGAAPSLPAPTGTLRLRDAFRQTEEPAIPNVQESTPSPDAGRAPNRHEES
jgi:membrane protein